MEHEVEGGARRTAVSQFRAQVEVVGRVVEERLTADGRQGPPERSALPRGVDQEEGVEPVVGQRGVAGRHLGGHGRLDGGQRLGMGLDEGQHPRRVRCPRGRVRRAGSQELQERRAVPDQEGGRAHADEVVGTSRRAELHGHAAAARDSVGNRRVPPRVGEAHRGRARPGDQVGRRGQSGQGARRGEGALGHRALGVERPLPRRARGSRSQHVVDGPGGRLDVGAHGPKVAVDARGRMPGDKVVML